MIAYCANTKANTKSSTNDGTSQSRKVYIVTLYTITQPEMCLATMDERVTVNLGARVHDKQPCT